MVSYFSWSLCLCQFKRSPLFVVAGVCSARLVLLDVEQLTTHGSQMHGRQSEAKVVKLHYWPFFLTLHLLISLADFK